MLFTDTLYLFGRDAVLHGKNVTFGGTYCLYLRRRNVLWRPSLTCSVIDDVTGWQRQTCRRYCFYPEDGGKSIPRNVGKFLLPDYTTHKPRWQPTSFYFFFPSSWYSSLPLCFPFFFTPCLPLIRHFPPVLFLTCRPSVWYSIYILPSRCV